MLLCVFLPAANASRVKRYNGGWRKEEYEKRQSFGMRVRGGAEDAEGAEGAESAGWVEGAGGAEDEESAEGAALGEPAAQRRT